MDNKTLARQIKLLGELLELHGESSFKTKSYAFAYTVIKEFPEPIFAWKKENLLELKGIGNAIADKIVELNTTGKISKLEEYLSITPVGILELLKIKGLGIKKIIALWKDLQIESPGELLYACLENRLTALKGFGLKTQEDVRQKVQYLIDNKGNHHFASIHELAEKLYHQLIREFGVNKLSFTGAYRRLEIVLDKIEFVLIADDSQLQSKAFKPLKEKVYQWIVPDCSVPIIIYQATTNNFGSTLFKTSGSLSFLKAFIEQGAQKEYQNIATEHEVFQKASIAYVLPELRSNDLFVTKTVPSSIIELKDIKGIVHAHTTYSDGAATLSQMVDYCKEQGFQYLVVTDHSQSAFYANGLNLNKLEQQWNEIDQLNSSLQDFKIFKGIESDILNDGSLDYENDILEKFDLIIASIHSNLRMDVQKATQRLLKAIENPYTTILGHPTGRLLLSREGYAIDTEKIIQACAANNVVIELNANPYRLDIDWTWIPYAQDLGVKISINPDAHSLQGIHDIKWGVFAARKAALSPKNCLSAFSSEAFDNFINKK